MPSPPRPGDLAELDRDRCLELLEAAPYVRIAFVVDEEATVLPVNHLVHDGAVYLATAAGAKLGSAAAGKVVTIEADEGDHATRIGWSVMAKGRASIVTEDAELEALHAHDFEPWPLPGERIFWIRVDVRELTGRQIVRPE